MATNQNIHFTFAVTVLCAILLSQLAAAAPVYNVEENYTREGKNIIKREAKTTVTKTDSDASGTGQGHDSSYQEDPPTSYVNYGAKTGPYGAYSWFSDHPVGGGGYGH